MDLRPEQAVIGVDAVGRTLMKVNVDTGKVSRVKLSGSAYNDTFHANFTWKRRTINSTKY